MNSRGVCLVVEDDQDIRELLCLILSGCGFDVHAGATGAEGLRAAAAMSPTLVTLDAVLPDMSGYQVAQGIRKISPTRILMITAWAQPTTELAGLDDGIDAYLTKPFRPARLRELAQRLCPKVTGPIPLTVPSAELPAAKPLR
jgi:DNA-binding response OmpR family regulator